MYIIERNKSDDAIRSRNESVIEEDNKDNENCNFVSINVRGRNISDNIRGGRNRNVEIVCIIERRRLWWVTPTSNIANKPTPVITITHIEISAFIKKHAFPTHPKEYTIGIDINNSKNQGFRPCGKICTCGKGSANFSLINITFAETKNNIMKTIDFAIVNDINGFKILSCEIESEDFSISLTGAIKAAFKDAETSVKVALLSNANKPEIAIAFVGAEVETGKDSKGYNTFTKCNLSEEGKEALLNL